MRFVVLLLSMGSVVSFGYALAGLAGFLLSRGRPDYILGGLFFGFASATTSLLLWKRWLADCVNEDSGGVEEE